MFYFETKKTWYIFTIFVCGYLSTSMFIYFGKAFTLVTKFSVLDVAGVLNPSHYALTWIAYRNYLIQATDER